jgi:hypothetical protein
MVSWMDYSVSSACWATIGFRGKFSFSAAGALGSVCACSKANAILNSLWEKILSLTCLKRQLLQQAGMQAFSTVGQRQKQQIGMESKDTKIITAKLLQRPLSMGVMLFRCSEITSNI